MQAVSGAGYPGVASMDILGQRGSVYRQRRRKDGGGDAEAAGRLEMAGDTVAPLAARMTAHCNRVAVVDGHTECVSIKLGKKLGRAVTREDILAAWAEFQAAGRAGSAVRARAAGGVGAAERPAAAAARPQSRQRHGGDRGPAAPLQCAGLEVCAALAQHGARRGRSNHFECRDAGEPGEAGAGAGSGGASMKVLSWPLKGSAEVRAGRSGL